MPLLCRLLLTLADFIVPRSARAEWKREWAAELVYRTRSGASLHYLLRSASGAFRDAAYIRAQTPFSFRFISMPLRAEAVAVTVAVLVCAWNGALVPARPHYSNLDRVFRVQRDLHFLGAVNRFFPASVLKAWAGVPGIEGVAAYRLNITKRYRSGQVSPNFFAALGVRMPGRRVGPADAMITDRFWRDALHANPKAVGSSFNDGSQRYTVAGILDPDFAFNQCSFFTALDTEQSLYALVLLRKGADRKKTTEDLIGAASTVAPGWQYASTRLASLSVPFTACSAIVAAASAMLGFAYALLRCRKIALYAGARIAVGMLSITAVELSLVRAVNLVFPFLSVLQFWPYIGLCSATVYFILRDQRSRCPTCFERLSMPVTLGSWSSLLLDRPATEYVCPAGHGVLLISEALHDDDRWTVLDESWRDLFAAIAPR